MRKLLLVLAVVLIISSGLLGQNNQVSVAELFETIGRQTVQINKLMNENSQLKEYIQATAKPAPEVPTPDPE